MVVATASYHLNVNIPCVGGMQNNRMPMSVSTISNSKIVPNQQILNLSFLACTPHKWSNKGRNFPHLGTAVGAAAQFPPLTSWMQTRPTKFAICTLEVSYCIDDGSGGHARALCLPLARPQHRSGCTISLDTLLNGLKLARAIKMLT